MSLTTAQTANLLGINASRVRQLIAAGVIRAEKHGRDWLIERPEIEKYRDARRTPGRPKETYMKLIEIRRRLAGSKAVQKHRKNYDPEKYEAVRIARARLANLLTEARADGKSEIWNSRAMQAIKAHDNAMIDLIGIPTLHAGRPMCPGR